MGVRIKGFGGRDRRTERLRGAGEWSGAGIGMERSDRAVFRPLPVGIGVDIEGFAVFGVIR